MSTLQLLLIVLTVSPLSCNKKTFRVGYDIGGNPYAVIVKRDGNNVTEVGGYAMDFFKWMSRDLKLTYQLVDIDFSEGFAGLSKEFAIKHIDLGLDVFGLMAGRNQLATFLYPFGNSAFTLIIPYPKRESDPWSCFRPFQLDVWILTLIAIPIVTVVLTITSSLRRRNKDTYWPLKETSMYVVGVVTNQGGYCSSRTRSLRLVAGFWCLGAFVLVNAYSSSLITYMTTPNLEPIVNSIEEMTKRDDIQLLALKYNFVRYLIQTGGTNLQPLNDNLNRVSNEFCGETLHAEPFHKCLDKVKNGGYAFASDVAATLVVIQEDYDRLKQCSITMIENPFFPSYAGFIIPINSTHQQRNALDTSVLKAMSYGLLDKWRSFYEPGRKNPCLNFRTQSQQQEMKQISLTDMISAFVVLAIGCALAFIAFLYEITRKKTNVTKN